MREAMFYDVWIRNWSGYSKIALWVYTDAKSRNSSIPLLWAVGVVACLIIFLPLYFILRPKKVPIHPQPSTDLNINAMKKNSTENEITADTHTEVNITDHPILCPQCGQYYKTDESSCPYCKAPNPNK